MSDSDPLELFDYLLGEFNQRNLSFIELYEGEYKPKEEDKIEYKGSFAATFKRKFNGTFIANGGFTYETGTKLV
jgi:2,4-dienoyl-CoA reductase-like NADH-dependent reductase (Old Yellow Enzyme family)